MNHAANPPADWFRNAIIDGVQLLYSLALDGSPAGEVLPLTTTGWIETLWRGGMWIEDLDAPRITAGFFSLARTVQRWPAPRQLVEQLPARPETPALAPPKPVVSPQRRQALAELRRRLTDHLLATPQLHGVRPYSPVIGACDGGAAGGNLCAPQHAPGEAERADLREH